MPKKLKTSKPKKQLFDLTDVEVVTPAPPMKIAGRTWIAEDDLVAALQLLQLSADFNDSKLNPDHRHLLIRSVLRSMGRKALVEFRRDQHGRWEFWAETAGTLEFRERFNATIAIAMIERSNPE